MRLLLLVVIASGTLILPGCGSGSTNAPPASDTQPPTAPTHVSATAVSPSQVTLTWTASTDNVGVAGYRVFRGGTQVANVAATAYSDTGLAAGTAYSSNVAAYDAAGNVSPLSQPAAVTTPASNGAPPPVYPLKTSASGRYLVDQNNVPFLITGDAPHSMLVNLSVADASAYLADRGAHGINTLWVEVLANGYVGNNNLNGQNGATYDGITPFTNSNDISTPNEAYFSRVDQMINIAASNGITVLLDAFETGGWMSFLEAQGNTKAFNWGAYLGNRYKNFPNIVWITGNDFQTWNTSAIDNNLIKNIMAGIASVDPNHLQTVELNFDISGSLDDALLAPYVSLGGVYTYFPTYDEVLVQYNKPNSPVPVMLQEAHYENENVGGCCGEGGTPNILRRQGYWSLLSGALAGQMYGNHYTWTFVSGWQNNLDTVGVTQLGYWKTFFTSLPWYNLAPDQTHSVVTAGFGTCDGLGSLGGDDCVTTARTSDGKLMLAYTPVNHTLTLDMTKLSGTATARWFDPSNGTYSTVSGSPFANSGTRPFTSPGTNAGGDHDWVLVLQVP